MWEWCDKLKLGKSSAFTKRDIRALPQTEAEFEADFFLDPEFSTESQEAWTGLVIEREHGSLLAVEDVRFPPPTVNYLASLLDHAMCRPPIMRIVSGHVPFTFGIDPNGRNYCPIFGNWASRSLYPRICPGSMRRSLSGCRRRRSRPLPRRSRPCCGSRFRSENGVRLPIQWNSWNGRMRCSRRLFRPARILPGL